jgi:pimeloyl-ACP methyl ester carboxylesterase
VLETPAGAQIQVGSTSLEIFSRGSQRAPTVLFLHDLDYVNGVAYPFVERLAERWRVVAPSHPGFGGSALPEEFDSVDDLAYVYLDCLAGLGPVHLVGAGFGGWIAAEMAVRCRHNLKSLTLVDALGIKVGDRTTADIKDVFVLSPRELVEACWHAPELGERLMPLPVAGGSKGFDEDTLTRLLTNRRTAALLGWNPFMHNPKLRARLRYLDLPTLVVWGASDRLVTPDYGRAYAAAIPRAEFALIPAAGHYPYLEQPADFVSSLNKQLDSIT